MVTTDRLQIRIARPEDLQVICELMATYDMVGDFTIENCLVAERGGTLAGFARVEYLSQRAYIRPIVIAAQFQGQGIGKLLMQRLFELDRSLAVVSRGSAVGFYNRLGFEPVDWEDIPTVYRNECIACPDYKTCWPVPLVWHPGAVK